MAPEKTAHVLASAVRGFKQTATTPADLRQLIRELLMLSFGHALSDTKAGRRSPLRRKR
jgi:hypothetical protein